MWRLIRLAIATPIVWCAVGTAADVLDHFPLQAVRQWTYDHYDKAGDREHPQVTRWTTIETVKAHVRRPEGLVIVLQVEQKGKSNGGWIASRHNTNYLIRDSCVYRLGDGWDAVGEALTEQSRRDLLNGDLSPEICFPLEIGRVWGSNQDSTWRVAGKGPGTEGSNTAYPQAFRLSYSWMQGPFLVWFQEGVGIVEERYSHVGTYGEYGVVLREFK